ncbi:MAG: Flagellar hook-associated protein 3, partial [Pseudomonadota bacterium]
MGISLSTNLFFDKATNQLQTVQSNLATTQEQLSTGLKVNRPSDAPDKASLLTNLISQIERQSSYQNTLKTIDTRLEAQHTALTNVSDELTRLKELAVQAANDTLSAADRESVAIEMKGIRDQILSLANSQDANSNYIFSGSRVQTAPFGKDATGRVVYLGDQSRMVVGVGDSRRMSMNMPGSDAFKSVVRTNSKGEPEGIDFFQSVDDVVNAVDANNYSFIQRGIDEIDGMQQNISDATAQVGSNMNVVDSQNAVLDEVKLRLQSTLSDIQDLDYTA